MLRCFTPPDPSTPGGGDGRLDGTDTWGVELAQASMPKVLRTCRLKPKCCPSTSVRTRQDLDHRHHGADVDGSSRSVPGFSAALTYTVNDSPGAARRGCVPPHAERKKRRCQLRMLLRCVRPQRSRPGATVRERDREGPGRKRSHARHLRCGARETRAGEGLRGGTDAARRAFVCEYACRMYVS